MKDRRGQVTIFIIVGILIVAAIVVFFLYVKPKIDLQGTKRIGFEGCVEDATLLAIGELGKSGGVNNPEFTYKYIDEDYTYLCYTNEFFKTCTVQVPFLKQTFERELEKKIKDPVETCYSNAVSELKSQGYDVVSGKVDYNVSVDIGTVSVKIDAPTRVGSGSFARFNVVIDSPIYEMLMLATSVMEYEVSYGDSDLDTIRLLYPDFTLKKIKRGDSTKIYIVGSKISGDEFRFASKSLVWPVGYN